MKFDDDNDVSCLYSICCTLSSLSLNESSFFSLLSFSLFLFLSRSLLLLSLCSSICRSGCFNNNFGGKNFLIIFNHVLSFFNSYDVGLYVHVASSCAQI